jgi:hypothetical protein
VNVRAWRPPERPGNIRSGLATAAGSWDVRSEPLAPERIAAGQALLGNERKVIDLRRSLFFGEEKVIFI